HLESEEEARQLVDAAVERLRGDGVQAEGQVGPGAGSTARDLLAIADSAGANLIVIGDRGSHVSDVLLGSVAHRVVHLAKIPGRQGLFEALCPPGWTACPGAGSTGGSSSGWEQPGSSTVWKFRSSTRPAPS